MCPCWTKSRYTREPNAHFFSQSPSFWGTKVSLVKHNNLQLLSWIILGLLWTNMLHEYREKWTAVWSRGPVRFFCRMKALSRQEKKRGVGPFTDKIHSFAGGKMEEMTRLWTFFSFSFFLSFPVIRVRKGEEGVGCGWGCGFDGRRVMQCCLSPSARTFHYILNNSDGVFCQHAPW